MISGTTDPEATVCITRGDNVIGTTIADGTGTFTVTLENGLILVEGDVLSIHAKAPDKAMSEVFNVTVAAALVQPQTISSLINDTSGDTTSAGTTDTGTTVSSNTGSTGDTTGAGTN